MYLAGERIVFNICTEFFSETDDIATILPNLIGVRVNESMRLIEFIFCNDALVRLHGDCMTKGITKTY